MCLARGGRGLAGGQVGKVGGWVGLGEGVLWGLGVGVVPTRGVHLRRTQLLLEGIPRTRRLL